MRRIRMTTAKWVRGSVRDRTSSSAHLSCLTIGMILIALHQNRNPVYSSRRLSCISHLILSDWAFALIDAGNPMVTYSHHFRFAKKWGFLFDSPHRLSIRKLSPRAPRFILFCPDTGFLSGFLSFPMLYTLRIRRPSSRMLTAAFTSLSIRFPHSQIYMRSPSPSSFFTIPQQLQRLLDG